MCVELGWRWCVVLGCVSGVFFLEWVVLFYMSLFVSFLFQKMLFLVFHFYSFLLFSCMFSVCCDIQGRKIYYTNSKTLVGWSVSRPAVLRVMKNFHLCLCLVVRFLEFCWTPKVPRSERSFFFRKDVVGDQIELVKGQELKLVTDYSFLGDSTCIAVSYPKLPTSVKPGGILCADGFVSHPLFHTAESVLSFFRIVETL